MNNFKFLSFLFTYFLFTLLLLTFNACGPTPINVSPEVKPKETATPTPTPTPTAEPTAEATPKEAKPISFNNLRVEGTHGTTHFWDITYFPSDDSLEISGTWIGSEANHFTESEGSYPKIRIKRDEWKHKIAYRSGNYEGVEGRSSYEVDFYFEFQEDGELIIVHCARIFDEDGNSTNTYSDQLNCFDGLDGFLSFLDSLLDGNSSDMKGFFLHSTSFPIIPL